MPSKSKRYAVGKRRCHNKKRVTKKAYKRCRVGYNYNLRSMRGGGFLLAQKFEGDKGGEIKPITIETTDKVVNLMEKVAKAFGVLNANDINLFFAGEELDDQTLANIPSGSTIPFTISDPLTRHGDRC